MSRLAAVVHAHNPETGRTEVFGPDSTSVPSWVAKVVTNPKAWEGGKAPRGTSGESDDSGELKGKALEEALSERGLSAGGSAEEKRARVAHIDALNALTVEHLRELGGEAVDVPASALKPELVAALVAADVQVPPVE